MKFVVYITYYTGDKLPPWYIGSSSAERVENGYNGSINSKKFKDIYRSEQKLNKDLFKTKILSYHFTRDEAMVEELRLHKKHNVSRNKKYMNLSFAIPGGLFGRTGRNHPQYGQQHSEEFCIDISLRQSGSKNSFHGKSHTKDSKRKISAKLKQNNKSHKGMFNDEALQRIKDKSGTCKDSAYLYNDELELCRRVSGVELKELLSKGWKMGRKVYKRNIGVDKINIYHKEQRKNRKIYPRELDYFLERGWSKGKYNFNRKSRLKTK